VFRSRGGGNLLAADQEIPMKLHGSFPFVLGRTQICESGVDQVEAAVGVELCAGQVGGVVGGQEERGIHEFGRSRDAVQLVLAIRSSGGRSSSPLSRSG
jgi:hypothetical protein